MNNLIKEKGDLHYIGIILLVVLSYVSLCFIFKEYFAWIFTFTCVLGIFDCLLVIGAAKNEVKNNL